MLSLAAVNGNIRRYGSGHGPSITAVGVGVDTDLLGPGTQVHDLRGANLLPGFIDARSSGGRGLAALRCT